MKLEEINTVCFVGSGTMGCFNALMAAVAGYRAVIYDVSADVLQQTPQSLRDMSDYLVNQNFYTADVVPDALKHIHCETDLVLALADAQLVSESIPEQLALKRETHRQLDQLCSKDVLITSNTSSMLVSELEDVFVHGQRFAALHSHLGSRLIDIVGGPRTSNEALDLLHRYVLSIEGLPLLLNKENPGYVLNAMIGPFLTISKALVIEEQASIEDVDRAWMRYQDAAIGPFGLMDLFGLNVIHDSWQKPKPGMQTLQVSIQDYIQPYIDRNHLGIKTGQGFYSYPSPSYSLEDFLSPEQDLSLIHQVMLYSLLAAAMRLAIDGIAKPSDIEWAWTVSFSLAKGPFAWLAEIGEEEFFVQHAELAQQGYFPIASVDKLRNDWRKKAD